MPPRVAVIIFSAVSINDGEGDTLHSSNLYQIFTYVKNKEAEMANRPHEVSGMLLYAKTDEDVYPENEYRMSGNRIEVRTLDLDLAFSGIKAQLDGIAEKYFGAHVGR